MNSLAISIVFGIAFLIHISLAYHGQRHRPMPGAPVFTIAVLLMNVWPLAQAADVTTSKPGVQSYPDETPL